MIAMGDYFNARPKDPALSTEAHENQIARGKARTMLHWLLISYYWVLTAERKILEGTEGHLDSLQKKQTKLNTNIWSKFVLIYRGWI